MKKYYISIAIVLVTGCAVFMLSDKKLPEIENTVQAKEQQGTKEENKNEGKIEKPEMLIGTSEEGKEFSYDAAEVARKLRSYDFYRGEEKTVFLTFDDGASTTITPQILKILKEEEVRATFFVIGDTIEKGGERAKALVREIFEQGNAIGNHTYGHNYQYLYPNRTVNVNHFFTDVEKTDKLLKEIIGENFSTRVIRCPGGMMSWKGTKELDDNFIKNNRVSIDWNALSKDAEGKKKNAAQLIENVKETSKDKKMVVLLMHDTYGKEETVKALPSIIRYFKEQGYQFRTLV
ncbi:peptidoglycan N-acetylglucosamine deacetylase [Lachnospiraceae bacterium KM106-2]|nr:peptidoglycan N-acetylglucosamine deacetylase [Lachnospiraceae bacterium KM106-2]